MTANASEMGFVRKWGAAFLCSKTACNHQSGPPMIGAVKKHAAQIVGATRAIMAAPSSSEFHVTWFLGILVYRFAVASL